MNGAQLADKVAIVTGAASGIGLAIATAFAREGARLVIIDRDAAGLAAAQQALSGAAETFVADVTDAEAMSRAVDLAVGRYCRLTTVVAAAGISFGKRLTDGEPHEWEQTFAVNVVGVMKLLKAAIPAMTRVGGGSIVTIASQLAMAGGRNNAAYVASKGAIISLTRSIAVDYASDGIRCNAVLPGAIETPMLARAFERRGDGAEAAREASRNRHALRRFGKPQEIAAAAVFLASDASAFITGVALPVDGGWLVA